MKRRTILATLGAAALAAAGPASSGCSCGEDTAAEGAATTRTDGPSGSDAGSGGGLFESDAGDGEGGSGGECAEPCGEGMVCSHGVCVPLTGCTSDDDCMNDTYCDPDQGCLPWADADPRHDPDCVYLTAAGILQPAVSCELVAAPAGDPFPEHVDVQSTPIVVNFNGFEEAPDGEPTPIGTPSIVATFTATLTSDQGGYSENLGVIRVLNGKDCSVEANLGGTDLDGDATVDWIVSSSSLAAGDLDGDGRPELVAYGADGAVLAFTRKGGAWSLLWRAPYDAGVPGGPCDPGNLRCPLGWAGPAIHDLDDDGKPEVLREGAVYSNAGKLLSGAPPSYSSYSSGLFSVTANLDQDPAIETTNGQYVWEWQGGAWVQEGYFPGATPSAPGHVAVADFGEYGAGVPAKNPELAVVRSGYAMVYAITGELAFGPIEVPSGGGGPPTIADFDGDGLPEIGVAGADYYSMFDIDCGPSPRPGGTCSAGVCDFGPCPAGVAWAKTTQDHSSQITGSSVFDFEADGTAEVVYADECFVRVYSGKTGEVMFSQYHSSCTWYENPIIADVDGDYRAELVVPSNKACSPNGEGIACEKNVTPDGIDMQFPGLRCQTNADCVSGVCDAGLCRCSASADCCASKDDAACIELGYKCAPPPDGTKGAGDTCRAVHPHGLSGIRVYGDANDKWVRSRMIWNQHAYAVTHVNEDGTIPKSSEWKNNWEQPGLDNFRQNVPGAKGGTATPDLTAGASHQFSCKGSAAVLTAPVCNRGTAPLGAGVDVGFFVDGALVCETQTTGPIAPDQCETVECTWGSPPKDSSEAVDVTVVPNHEGALNECKTGNNEGVVLGVYCKPLG